MKRAQLRSLLPIWTVFAAGCAATDAAPPGHHSEVAAASSPAPALSGSQTAVHQRDPAAPAEDRVVGDLIELSKRDNRVQAHLEHLCLAIGPRLTSSHNLAKAQEWAVEQFRSWGLDANLEKWGEFPVGFDRGPFRGGIVGDPSVQFVFTTSSWTPGTNGPKRGRALVRPESEEQLAAVKDALPGAWLVTRTYPRGTERPKVETAVRDKINAAINEAGIAGEIRSAGGDLVLTGGQHEIKWDKLPKLTRVSLRGDQHKDLVERIDKGDPVEVEFDIDNRFYEGPVPQFNVIADIRGSEWPDEYVIVGGHLDSWDGAQGTVDNGTGSATTLEAARLLKAVGTHPKRTIRFALWSGEEQGLFGSAGYVRDHKDQLDKISAVYIHDEGTNYLSGLGVTYDMEPQMRAVCAPLFELDPEMPFKLRVMEGFSYSGGSDHASFAAKGVPGFFWDQSGKSDYNHMHHTQYDTIDSAIPEYQKHSALVVAIAAYNTANLPEMVNRDNFKPVPRRRMGVQLDGTKLQEVTEGGKAEQAGWKVGDVVVSMDGVAVASQNDLTEQLQQGGPKKVVVLLRDGQKVETVLDYSGSPDEAEREKRAEMRASLRTEREQTQKKKFW